jgi:hypothetical protein
MRTAKGSARCGSPVASSWQVLFLGLVYRVLDAFCLLLPHHFAPRSALLVYIDSVFVLSIDFTASTGLSPIYPLGPAHELVLVLLPARPERPHKAYVTWARSIIIGPQLPPAPLNLRQHHQVVVNLNHQMIIA